MESMIGQDINHSALKAILCAVILCCTPFNAALSDEKQTVPYTPAIEAFYKDWSQAQRSTIKDLKLWLDDHLDEHSHMEVKVIAEIPALLDYKFHKTLKIDQKQAEKHLVQWLNIHKHNQFEFDILESKTDETSYLNKVAYTAQGVTVLPHGRHKTIRMKTSLNVLCNDQLNKDDLKLIHSNCMLNATSVPLRSIK